MCFHPQKSDLGANNRTLAVGHVAKLSVKTEVSQTTPPHTRNFWKHSGTFQDKILGHFRARGVAKGAQSVFKMLLLLMVFFGDLPCVLVEEEHEKALQESLIIFVHPSYVAL